MAFTNTAARGPSRTRSAGSKARLEGRLPLSPPSRGFLEAAPPPTPSPRPSWEWERRRRALLWWRLREGHSSLRACGVGSGRGGAYSRLRVSSKLPDVERRRPRASGSASAAPAGAWLAVPGARRRVELRAGADCRTSSARVVARDPVTLRSPRLPLPRCPAPGEQAEAADG